MKVKGFTKIACVHDPLLSAINSMLYRLFETVNNQKHVPVFVWDILCKSRYSISSAVCEYLLTYVTESSSILVFAGI